MTKYARLCEKVKNKGLLLPLDTIINQDKLNKYIKRNPYSDWYTSVYYYGPESINYFRQNGNSIKDYTGSAFSKKLIFDFDSDKIINARNDAITLLNRLNDHGINVRESALVYFSGCKGFHVEVFLDKELHPDILKKVCSSIAKGLPTFDESIYNITRLIRLNNTKHQVTGLYKIGFTPLEFKDLDIEKIKELAKIPKKLNFEPIPIKDFNEENFIKEIEKEVKPKLNLSNNLIKGIRGINNIDFSKCPAHTPRCVYALSKGIMVPMSVNPYFGGRSRVFFRLATYYRNEGLDKDLTKNLLKGIADLNNKLYPEAELISESEIDDQHIASVYNTNSNFKQIPGAVGTSKENDLLKLYCKHIDSYTDKKCKLHGAITKKSIIKVNDLFDSFSKFAENYNKNRIPTGIEFIDRYMHISTGTTTLLVGSSGSGKTTMALNMLENANKIGVNNMFFSLDMHKTLVLIKLGTKLTNYKKEEIIKFFETKNELKKKEILEAVKKYYGRTFFDFTGAVSMDDMKQKVLNINESLKEKGDHPIKLVIVDYASRIVSDHKDRYANSTFNALRSKDVADDTDAAWIYISQISRNHGDAYVPLRTKRAAKESGDWEETATNVITMWRPYYGTDQDNIARIFLAKNRMGQEKEIPLKWDGAKSLIQDMDSDELEDYIATRESDEEEVLRRRFRRG